MCLVELLAAMPSFRDVAIYRGRAVPYYKRAQLAAADLALALGGAGLGAFDDRDRLTIFADNLVPHVLRVDGVLRYDDTLAARVAAGELLLPGEPSEVEIRAAAVHAVELLVAACRGMRQNWDIQVPDRTSTRVRSRGRGR
ncbi:MAG: queuosine salvage family protein [Chloroflexota bacterium]|nr:queuosine salvage family protein [Chloroflexota bacterium]